MNKTVVILVLVLLLSSTIAVAYQPNQNSGFLSGLGQFFSKLFKGHPNNALTGNVVAPPTSRKISYYCGKVNQHLVDGQWMTDSDGTSGCNIPKLDYCKKFWPDTVSVEEAGTENITTWRDGGNTGGPYSSVRMTYNCEAESQPEPSVENEPQPAISDSNSGETGFSHDGLIINQNIGDYNFITSSHSTIEMGYVQKYTLNQDFGMYSANSGDSLVIKIYYSSGDVNPSKVLNDIVNGDHSDLTKMTVFNQTVFKETEGSKLFWISDNKLISVSPSSSSSNEVVEEYLNEYPSTVSESVLKSYILKKSIGDYKFDSDLRIFNTGKVNGDLVAFILEEGSYYTDDNIAEADVISNVEGISVDDLLHYMQNFKNIPSEFDLAGDYAFHNFKNKGIGTFNSPNGDTNYVWISNGKAIGLTFEFAPSEAIRKSEDALLNAYLNAYPVTIQEDFEHNSRKISYYCGKVNQHLVDGQWMTDSDGTSGCNISKLDYCKKFWPDTNSVVPEGNEIITTWEDRGNDGNYYMSTKDVFYCSPDNSAGTSSSSYIIQHDIGKFKFDSVDEQPDSDLIHSPAYGDETFKYTYSDGSYKYSGDNDHYFDTMILHDYTQGTRDEMLAKTLVDPKEKMNTFLSKTIDGQSVFESPDEKSILWASYNDTLIFCAYNVHGDTSLAEAYLEKYPSVISPEDNVGSYIIRKNIDNYEFNSVRLYVANYSYEGDSFKYVYDYGTYTDSADTAEGYIGASIIYEVKYGTAKRLFDDLLNDPDGSQIYGFKKVVIENNEVYISPDNQSIAWISGNLLITMAYKPGSALVSAYLKRYPSSVSSDQKDNFVITHDIGDVKFEKVSTDSQNSSGDNLIVSYDYDVAIYSKDDSYYSAVVIHTFKKGSSQDLLRLMFDDDMISISLVQHRQYLPGGRDLAVYMSDDNESVVWLSGNYLIEIERIEPSVISAYMTKYPPKKLSSLSNFDPFLITHDIEDYNFYELNTFNKFDKSADGYQFNATISEADYFKGEGNRYVSSSHSSVAVYHDFTKGSPKPLLIDSLLSPNEGLSEQKKYTVGSKVVGYITDDNSNVVWISGDKLIFASNEPTLVSAYMAKYPPIDLTDFLNKAQDGMNSEREIKNDLKNNHKNHLVPEKTAVDGSGRESTEPAKTSSKDDCDGCLIGNDSCVPVGFRTGDEYCSLSHKMTAQVDGACQNNFECTTNLCMDGSCVEQGLIQKIFAWFSKLFA